jgi:hypothetical protein
LTADLFSPINDFDIAFEGTQLFVNGFLLSCVIANEFWFYFIISLSCLNKYFSIYWLGKRSGTSSKENCLDISGNSSRIKAICSN